MNKILRELKFKILLIMIISLGFGSCMYYIKKESDYISKFHSLILPIIATKSFYIGCITGSKGDVQFCNRIRESYKYEILSISKLEE